MCRGLRATAFTTGSKAAGQSRVRPLCRGQLLGLLRAADRGGAPSVTSGRYLQMLLIGYFEGIHSERGIIWRCSDSLSLREFLRLTNREKVPDRS